MRGGSFAVRKAIRFRGRMAFLRLEKLFLLFFGQTLSKAIVRDVICYGRIHIPPQGSGKEKMKKPFRNFFKKFPERLPKPKICEVIIYEKENACESGPDLRKEGFA